MKRFFLVCVLSVLGAVGCGNVPANTTGSANNTTPAPATQNANGATPPAASPAQAASSPAARSPEIVVREFYQWYLGALKRNEDPFRQGLTTMRRYVTGERITELQRQLSRPEGIDADYFLQAQDWGDDWETNVAVTGTEQRGATATTTVNLGAQGSEFQQRLRVTLQQQAEGWRIDRVESMMN